MSVFLSTKLIEAAPAGSPRGRTLWHWCPGCKRVHAFEIEKPNPWGAMWTWNGDTERPTFTPSMHLPGRCHYFLTDGRIQYLADSTHHLAGQVVDLPDFPSAET